MTFSSCGVFGLMLVRDDAIVIVGIFVLKVFSGEGSL